MQYRQSDAGCNQTRSLSSAMAYRPSILPWFRACPSPQIRVRGFPGLLIRAPGSMTRNSLTVIPQVLTKVRQQQHAIARVHAEVPASGDQLLAICTTISETGRSCCTIRKVVAYASSRLYLRLTAIRRRLTTNGVACPRRCGELGLALWQSACKTDQVPRSWTLPLMTGRYLRPCPTVSLHGKAWEDITIHE